MTKGQKFQLHKIIITAVLFIASYAITGLTEVTGLIFLIPYVIIGYDVIFKAGRNILNGQVFDENFLMAIASIGAVLIGEYPEAVAVMLFYKIGELFEAIAVGKSRNSISELMELRPDSANIERDGEIETCDPYEVCIGDIIVVRPGEKVPVDGVVISGSCNLDTKALTGEPAPRFVSEGEEVISGCVSLDGLIRIRAEKEFDDSTVSKILELVENSSLNKSKSEDFITKFAAWYTPLVVISAALIAVIPILLGSEDILGHIKSALIFLVVSCPCALVVSVPLTFFGGIGGASKKGILIKGANHLEALAEAKIAVFDKTGTLTKGEFEITHVETAEGIEESELVKYAALAEYHSNHPISAAIKRNCSDLTDDMVHSYRENAGKGVAADTVYGMICAGNAALMEELGVEFSPVDTVGTKVYVAKDGVYLGAITLEDAVKPEAKRAISDLNAVGIRKTVMLTGDSEETAVNVANRVGIDEVHSRLLPGDKVACLEEILDKAGKGKVIYTGDGINDAPVIMRADIGVAMGALGSDAALEAADVVLINDNIDGLAEAIRISKITRRIVTQNIVIALGVKFSILILGALEIAGMWSAVFADVGVLIIAVLNAIRTLNV